MKAAIIGSDHDTIYLMCVNREVHIECMHSGSDEQGDYHHYRNLTLCNCIDKSLVAGLPKEVEDLVEKFLKSDGREKGEFKKRFPAVEDKDILEAERAFEAQEMGGHLPNG